MSVQLFRRASPPASVKFVKFVKAVRLRTLNERVGVCQITLWLSATAEENLIIPSAAKLEFVELQRCYCRIRTWLRSSEKTLPEAASCPPLLLLFRCDKMSAQDL